MLRVVQVNCVLDPERRDPEALLEAWPTLPAVAEATARAGAELLVVQASHAPAAFVRNGIRYRFVRERFAARSAGHGLIGAVHDEAPDVVHLNGLDFPLQARRLSALPAPLLVQDHASRAAHPRLALLRRWGHGRVAGAAFTSLAQAAPFLETGQLPRHLPIFAVPESSSRFAPGSRREARRRTGVSGEPALLWIGHLDANKDPLTILRAAAIALEDLPGLRLWCAFAATHLLEEVRALLRAHPALAARTHLIGRVPHGEIEHLCRACDLFVSGSHREGSGYALIEAMACGLPPVVSDIPSFRALTGNGAVGRLVAPGDVNGFARAIVEASRPPRAPARQAVRAHFDRHLSFDIVGRRLVEAYAAIAGPARAP